MPSSFPVSRTANRPRLDAYIGSDRLPGIIDAEVTQNVTQNCDSFRVTLSLSQLEKAGSPYGWGYWASTDQVVMDLRFGSADGPGRGGAPGLQPFFTGYADDIRIDPIRNQVQVSGHDGSILLVQDKIAEKFPNLTASQIAQKLAERNGFATAITATKTLSGRFYAVDRVRLPREQTAWDLLTFLAQQEGFETYVTGHTLYFGPKPPPGEPFLVTWRRGDPETGGPPACNAVSLAASRNLIVARGIEVTVRSWNARLGRAFTAVRRAARAPGTATRGRGSAAARLSGGPQLYSFDPPGLDQQGVERFAEEQLRNLTRHELRLKVGLGAEMTLGHQSLLRLQGTGTEFDQLYYPEEIRRVQSYERGFTTSVTAKNHDTARRPGASASGSAG